MIIHMLLISVKLSKNQIYHTFLRLLKKYITYSKILKKIPKQKLKESTETYKTKIPLVISHLEINTVDILGISFQSFF